MMLIDKIRSLEFGSVIPKPAATADFKIKCWGKRRGEIALIYFIPNHKSPSKPLSKGITISEFQHAYDEITKNGKLTRAWFNSFLPACAKEGGCNFTSIGGIFVLLGIAKYEGHGVYSLCP